MTTTFSRAAACGVMAGIALLATPLPVSSEPFVPPAHATGTFDVKVTPTAPDAFADGALMGRLTIEKVFHGDIAGTSRGQMLTGLTSTNGSGAYVAIERVTATLAGRTGTFLLHHVGVMERGAQTLVIAIVPDSGTDQLTGITGTMTITVTPGTHAYDLEYRLP